MQLRKLAEQDLSVIMEDDTHGFGWSIVITDPEGQAKPFTGLSDDIAQVIDPETGQAVSGRLASVAVRMSSLAKVGFTLPEGIADASKKPWLVEFEDINGCSFTFKVSRSNPDRALGVVTLLLETYKDD